MKCRQFLLMKQCLARLNSLNFGRLLTQTDGTRRGETLFNTFQAVRRSWLQGTHAFASANQMFVLSLL